MTEDPGAVIDTNPLTVSEAPDALMSSEAGLTMSPCNVTLAAAAE